MNCPQRLQVRPEVAAHIRPFVPIELEPTQIAELRLEKLLPHAADVEILDAENKGSGLTPYL
jgi:hypothetical protein